MAHTPALQRNVAVVILTGLEAPSLVKKAWRLGADAYLLKPLGFEKEVEMVRALYERWSGPGLAPRRKPGG